MTRDYAGFGPVRSNILDLSVHISEAGSSLIVYTKLEGGGGGGGLAKMTDSRRADRQTDALLTYAQACIFLSCSTL